MQALGLAMLALAAFPLGGCANNNVVVEPIALKPVKASLLAMPKPPKCDLPPRKDYAPEEVKAYAECWRAAYEALFSSRKALVMAVKQRQDTAAKAVKAAKL